MFTTLNSIESYMDSLAETLPQIGDYARSAAWLAQAIEETIQPDLDRWTSKYDAFEAEVREATLPPEGKQSNRQSRAWGLAYLIEWKLDNFGYFKHLMSEVQTLTVGLTRMGEGDLDPMQFLYHLLYQQARNVERIMDRKDWDNASTSAGSNINDKAGAKACIEYMKAVNVWLDRIVKSFRDLADSDDLSQDEVYLELASFVRRVNDAKPYVGQSW